MDERAAPSLHTSDHTTSSRRWTASGLLIGETVCPIVYTNRVEWTPDRALVTDQRVRRGLQHSRADLIQFVAESGWKLLPGAPGTAAAYVQDAAGVKRSEAYRIVATARIVLILLTRIHSPEDGPVPNKAYQWMLKEIINSTHHGEYLCSITHELINDIEQRKAQGVPYAEGIKLAVEAHPRPANDAAENEQGPAGQPQARPDGTAPSSDAGDGDGDGDADGGPAYPKFDELERAERVLICPHCQMPLR